MSPASTPALATLGGGCFWCTEAAFTPLDGVLAVRPGYMGGHTAKPDYETVCSGQSGHAEVIEIAFDPARIDFETVLTVFFASHDPTSLNRQGADVGSQYRSVIFFHDANQESIARQLIARFDQAGYWPAPIVTEVTPASTFHVAEAYHHDYFRRNPGQGYCQVVIAPKVAKLRQHFANLLKPDAA